MEARVPPGVFGQMVAPHEALVAHGTVEALLAGVRAVVTRQLVRPRELLAALWPGALKRSLTGVDPQMGFEVRRLSVHLPTTGKRAAVALLGGLLSRRPPRHLPAPGLFGDERASVVPGVQPAAPPLHLLLHGGLAAPQASAASGGDGTGAAFVQVQQNHRHHEQSPVLLVLFQNVLRPARGSAGDAVRGDIHLRHEGWRKRIEASAK